MRRRRQKKNSNSYQDFLANKHKVALDCGFESDVSGNGLYDFQEAITSWALRRGRAAIFADCGLGKTPMQLVWADRVAKHTGGDVLIVAPLAVSGQTIDEGKKFGVDVSDARDPFRGVGIINYERLHSVDLSQFAGIVLDESSILKSHTGKTRQSLIDGCQSIPYRLACTATPSPNDYMELGNHSEFLGIMTRTEMLSMFFVHDAAKTQDWRLKGHAQDLFWEWVASWAVMIRSPEDIGFDGSNFVLPPIEYHEHVIKTGMRPAGKLVNDGAMTLGDRRYWRKKTMDVRIQEAARIANSVDGQVLVWCERNAEGDALTNLIDGAVQVAGADSDDDKFSRMLGFAHGEIDVLVTKPKIAGWGMNWQSCSNMVFVGLSDSWEQLYQAVRRCWRFGQKNKVNVHIVSTDVEGAVVANVKRKEKQNEKMATEMVKHMKDAMNKNIRKKTVSKLKYNGSETSGDSWRLFNGDCVDFTGTLEDDSIDYCIFSPPFASLYTYSDSVRDMGNCKDDSEFIKHFQFLINQLHRVMKPGRLVSFHCMNLPTSKARDGVIGIRDFRGELIRAFESEGFIFHSEVCIWKNPVTAMQRTKALGLLYKQLKKDSTMSRQGIPDYLVTMRKLGENTDPVTKDPDEFPVDLWQRYASPVWMDINPSNTLQYRSARDHKDERHICPLQLDVIRRGVELWTNPGDLVYTPFAGIGSEMVVSIEMGRRALGAELKSSYAKQALLNCRNAEKEFRRKRLV